MTSYVLSKDAEADIRDIIRYTRKTWGQKQVNVYRLNLKQHFERIGDDAVIPRIYSPSLHDVYFIKAGSHFVFYLKIDSSKPIIIGVVHEARNILQHLLERI